MKSDSPEPAGPGPAAAGGRLDHEAFLEMHQSPEFQRLKTKFRRFVFPMAVAFLAWYLLYVVLSAYARPFMSTKVVGEINVALVFGLLQFVSTFLIAWAYERYASRKLEPLAAQVVQPILESLPGTKAGPETTAGPETKAGPGGEAGPEATAGPDAEGEQGTEAGPDTEEEGK